MNRSSFFKFYNKYGIFVFLCVVLVFFSIFAPNFFSFNNMITILRQVSVLGTIVCALAIILISGGMDLSVGAQVAMGGVVTARLLTETSLPIPLVIVIALLVGAILGFLNGFISLKLNIAPMIETLGMMLVLQGLALVITGGYPIFGIPDKFKVIGQGYVFNKIPVPVIIFILVVIVTQFILKKTYFGRYIYAIGGNRDAAHLAGININKLHIAIYAIGGVLTSIASLLLLGRVGSGQPTAGSSYAFDCMSGAVLGGISIRGGEGSVIGAVLGIVIIGILDNGMLLMGMDPNWQDVIKGVVLILAVGLDGLQSMEKTKKSASKK